MIKHELVEEISERERKRKEVGAVRFGDDDGNTKMTTTTMGIIGKLRQTVHHSPLFRRKRRIALVDLEDKEDNKVPTNTVDDATSTESMDSFEELVVSRGCSYELLQPLHQSHDSENSRQQRFLPEDGFSQDDKDYDKENADAPDRHPHLIDVRDLVPGSSHCVLLSPKDTTTTTTTQEDWFSEESFELHSVDAHDTPLTPLSQYPDPDLTIYVSGSSSSDEEDDYDDFDHNNSHDNDKDSLQGMTIETRIRIPQEKPPPSALGDRDDNENTTQPKRRNFKTPAPRKQPLRNKEGRVGHLFHQELATLYEEEDGKKLAASSSSNNNKKKLDTTINSDGCDEWADEINIKARWEYALRLMMGASSCSDPILEILLDREKSTSRNEPNLELAEI